MVPNEIMALHPFIFKSESFMQKEATLTVSV